jgi:hypothetical protein
MTDHSSWTRPIITGARAQATACSEVEPVLAMISPATLIHWLLKR